MTNNEKYRPFKDYKEAFENSDRIVKHKSLINVPDVSASFYISKTRRYVEFLIHVLCPVDSLWGIYLNLKTKTNAGSYIWITINPEDFLEHFIFYDTKEPCGVIEQKGSKIIPKKGKTVYIVHEKTDEHVAGTPISSLREATTYSEREKRLTQYYLGFG